MARGGGGGNGTGNIVYLLALKSIDFLSAQGVFVDSSVTRGFSYDLV